MDQEFAQRMQNMAKLSPEEQEILKAHLSVKEAQVIMTKAEECPLRPVPVKFARELRRSQLAPPPGAFRNWAKMAQWYKNS